MSMDSQEARSGVRKKLSGHWGGNETIEKLYGKLNEDTKQKVINHMFLGYESRSKTDYYEKCEQTELILGKNEDPELLLHLGKYFNNIPQPLVPKESAPKISPAPVKIKKTKPFSEIMMGYANNCLDVNVFHLLKNRHLHIPVKDVKQHFLRIIIAPPIVEIYLGSNQIYPFDLGRILKQDKRSEDEKMWEILHKLPQVSTIQMENLQGFGSSKKYSPNNIRSPRYRRAIHSGQPLFRDTKKTKCLQKNLINMHNQGMTVTESDISSEQPSISSIAKSKCSCRKFISFISEPIEGTKIRTRDKPLSRRAKLEEEAMRSEEGIKTEPNDMKFHTKNIQDSISITKIKSTSKENLPSAKKSMFASDTKSSRPSRYVEIFGPSKYTVPSIAPIVSTEEKEEEEVSIPISKDKEKKQLIAEFEKAIRGSESSVLESSPHALKSRLKKKLSTEPTLPRRSVVMSRGAYGKPKAKRERERKKKLTFPDYPDSDLENLHYSYIEKNNKDDMTPNKFYLSNTSITTPPELKKEKEKDKKSEKRKKKGQLKTPKQSNQQPQ